jgi:hypothetical protein
MNGQIGSRTQRPGREDDRIRERGELPHDAEQFVTSSDTHRLLRRPRPALQRRSAGLRHGREELDRHAYAWGALQVRVQGESPLAADFRGAGKHADKAGRLRQVAGQQRQADAGLSRPELRQHAVRAQGTDGAAGLLRSQRDSGTAPRLSSKARMVCPRGRPGPPDAPAS